VGTLNQFIDDVIEELRTIPGVGQVPDDPVDSIASWPFVPVSASIGTSMQEPEGMIKYQHDIQVGYLAPRERITIANQVVLPQLETVIEQLWTKHNDDVNGFRTNISTFVNIDYSYGPIEWEGIPMFGLLLDIKGIKIENAL
jgi:hypothetical protein